MQVQFEVLKRQESMATIAKKGGIGKERKGSSASPSPSTSSRKPSKPSLSSSTRTTPTSSCDHERPTTPSDTKPIPNYLKPTISSIPKRATTDGATLNQTLKPVLNRMRSFDKIPPSPQAQKVIRGSSTPGARDPRTTRSLSFSHKTTTSASASASSTRPRNVPKGSKFEPHSRGLKKSTLLPNTAKRDPKWEASSSSTKKAPKSVASEPCMNSTYDTNSIGHHLDIDDHDMVNIDDHDLQSLPEISEMPEADQELGDPTNIDNLEVKQEDHKRLQPIEESYDQKGEEPPIEDDHEHKNEGNEQESLSHPTEDDEHHSQEQEISTVVNQPLEVSMEQDIESPEKPHHVEEEKDENQTTYEKHLDEEIIVKEDPSTDHQQEAEVECVGEQSQVEQGAGDQAGLDHEAEPTNTLPEEKKEEKEEKLPEQAVEENKAEENTNTQIETETETPVTTLQEEKQQTVGSPLTPTTDSGSISNSTEVKQVKETNEKQAATTEEKNEKQATTTVKRATTTSSGGGKKETQAYNDVIEETSKKLMGKKNKVLALAGAFETVISLQDTSPSKN